VGKALVADGKTTTSLTFGAGAYGEAALAPGSTYYFYAVARDAAGNPSAVLSASASPAAPTLNGFSAYWRYPSAASLASETGAGGTFDGAGTKYTWYNGNGNGAPYYGINVAASPSARQTTTCDPVSASATAGLTAAVRIVPSNASATTCGYSVLLYNGSGAAAGTLEFVTGETARYVRVLDAAGTQLARQDITDASAFYNAGWYNYYIYAYYNYYVRLVPVAGSPGTYDCVFNVHYNNNGSFSFSYTYRASFSGVASAALRLFNQGSVNMYAYNPWVYSSALTDSEIFKVTPPWNVDPNVINFSGAMTGTRGALQSIGASAMGYGNGMFLKYVVPAGATRLEMFCFGGGGDSGGFSYGSATVAGGQSFAVITGATVYPGTAKAAAYPAYAQLAATYGTSHPQYTAGSSYGARYGFGIGGALTGVFELFDPTALNMSSIRAKSVIIAGGYGTKGNVGGTGPAAGGGLSGATGATVNLPSQGLYGQGGGGGTQTAAGSGWMNALAMHGPGGNPMGDKEGGSGGGGYFGGGGAGTQSTGGGGSGYIGGTPSFRLTAGYTQNQNPGTAPASVASASSNAAAVFTAYAANADKSYGVMYLYAS
jgi:hypothetical protein